MQRTRTEKRERAGAQARCAKATCTAFVALLLAYLLPVVADGAVHPAVVVDGPSNAILGVAGAAMAADGTGGVVYRKQVAGVTHVYAAQFAAGHWDAPTQVDLDDTYGASQPAIAAGEGGRLLVVWVQARNVNYEGILQYELMGAALEPGANGFSQPIVIDPSVGEPASGDVAAVDPQLAMAPDGVAYVVYRVVTNDCHGGGGTFNPACPRSGTDMLVSVRVARYDYLLWSSLGAVNRAPQIAMRNPTSANAPAIGIDDLADNQGLVAWQEPDSSGVARIWVRRLFGTVQGNVLQASPETLGGKAVTSDAETPSVAVSPEGEARIAFRIHGEPGSAVTNTQLFVNQLPSTVDFHGGQLSGATPIPAAAGGVEQSSAAIDIRGDYRLAWTQNGVAQALAGSDEALGSVQSLGGAEGQTLTTINPAGGGITAWPARAAQGQPAVDVREENAQGQSQLAHLAGNIPGVVSGLSLGGDGEGDALIAWMQGPAGDSEVVGAFDQAPPAPFQVTTPIGWVGARGAQISWTTAPDAVTGVTYSIYIDGQPQVQGLTRLAQHLNTVGLGDGVHNVQVIATDAAGQRTASIPGKLKIDVNPPVVTLAFIDRRRGVRVNVRDDASGVDAGATRISFGDGRRSRGHKAVGHVYKHAGTYLITAHVRDDVGNEATVHLRVRVQ
jgi:hypothetical protein